jgi:hypothetical protein
MSGGLEVLTSIQVSVFHQLFILGVEGLIVVRYFTVSYNKRYA